MLNYGQILKLLDAGYTREEINQMNQEPEPEPEQTPEPEAQQPDQTLALNDALSGLLNEIKAGIRDLQAANILQLQQKDEPAKKPMTDVEALEELIRPKRAK